MSDHRRLAVEKADRLEIVVGDALHHLVREHTRVLVRLLDRVGVVGPSGCDGDEVVGLEQIPPLLPAAGQQPQSVHKGHRRQPRLVRTVDLGLLPVGNGARCKGSLSCRFSPLSRPAHLSRVQEFGSPNLSRPLRLIDKRVRAGLDVRRSPHVVRAGSGTRPPGHHAAARRSPQRRLSDTAALHHERPDGSSGVAAGCGHRDVDDRSKAAFQIRESSCSPDTLESQAHDRRTSGRAAMDNSLGGQSWQRVIPSKTRSTTCAPG